MTDTAFLFLKLPETVDEVKAAMLRSRLSREMEYAKKENGFDYELRQLRISADRQDISTVENDLQHFLGANNGNRQGIDAELNIAQRAERYVTHAPYYTFDALMLPHKVMEQVLLAIDTLKLEKLVFEQWGLRKIEPFPRAALNFYGAPGTGKTLAAHAIADYLGLNILIGTYAEIESKYHGDGPKNIDAIFYAAKRDNALLFIDEADSLLSKRLSNISQGSEQAINSMRSQLLISLEKFSGIVIFATNLIDNYDHAFETRIRNIFFPKPDFESRHAIWKCHLAFEGGPPLAQDIDIQQLAEIEDIVGRDIKNAVIDAALKAARENRIISQNDVLSAISAIKNNHPNKAQSQVNAALENKPKSIQ